MKKIETGIKDLYILEPIVFEDERGFFVESYSKRTFEEMGLFYDFIQDNHSYSRQIGTVRGLHLQIGEFAQAKLVRCTRGEVFDVAVDLRKNSESFLKWFGVRLSEKNKKQFLIPRGFAHGFITLTEEVDFMYKTDNYYNLESERTIRYDDKKLEIEWGYDGKITLSKKDDMAKGLMELICEI